MTEGERSKRRINKTIAAVAVMGALIAVTMIGVNLWEDQRFAVEGGDSAVTTKAIITQPKTMTVDGVDYIQRTGVESYLFMGIDVLEDTVEGAHPYNGGGQSDFLALVVVDNDAQTWRIVHVNRDTMWMVPVLTTAGESIGEFEMQVALSYAYGNDDRQSCINASNVVSSIFSGQQIDGYLSFKMDALAVLNDSVGGVTLEVKSDFSKIDPSLVQGETVTLNGKQAIEYVRSRWNIDDETNLARMERQRQYMSAFVSQAKGLSDEDLIRTYDDIADYSYSNMGSGGIVDLAEKMNKYEQLPTVTLAGEAKLGEEYMEYRLDDEELLKTTLDLFYEKQ